MPWRAVWALTTALTAAASAAPDVPAAAPAVANAPAGLAPAANVVAGTPAAPATGAATASAAPVASAPAPPDVGDETIIIVEGSEQARRRRALGEAPFVTVLVASEQRGRSRSVAEAAASTVGAQVRATGGLGSSAYLSIRGAAWGHTGISLDGIALSRLTSVSVDLGRFQLDELEAVEIYRGSVPVELGGAGVGGAVNLLTRVGPGADGERWWASVSAGSHGTRRASARYGDRIGATELAASAGYLTTDGDYLVFSDAGTPLNAGDDTWARRGNNAATQADAVVRARRPTAGDGRLTAGLRTTWRRTGLAGLAAAPALHASLSTGLVLADVDDERTLAGAAVRHRAYALAEWQRFRDRHDEIGLAAQDRQYLTLGAGASSTWRRRLGRHGLVVSAEGRLERFRDRDVWMDGPTLRGARQAAALSLGDELAGREWSVSAALRLELVRTEPARSPSVGAVAVAPRTELAPSPRLTARAMASDDLVLKASAGLYVRLPTAIELFGDRGFIVGSPELRAETGPSFEAGVVWGPPRRGPLEQVLVELAGFYNRAEDAIVLVNTGYAARPQNLGAAENFGLEAAGRLRLAGVLAVSGAYTLQRSAQRDPERSFDGKDLPRHPRHTLSARAELAGRVAARAARVHGEWLWTSVSYLDRANLQRVPQRQLVSAGASVELGQALAVSLEVRNLLDHQVEEVALDPPPSPMQTSAPAAVADIAGLPLPGRSLLVSLEWSR